MTIVGKSMFSLRNLVIFTPPIDRTASWQSRQREKLRNEAAARAGLISWRDLSRIPVEHQVRTRPTRTCQWISDDGLFCDAPSVLGRSWCAQHLRRVFVVVGRNK
jgi:hypothetical protein